VSDHLNREVTKRGMVRSCEHDVCFGLSTLDDGTGATVNGPSEWF
jgi:hypothetical protein